jgi:YVTN family beta-propeller protein
VGYYYYQQPHTSPAPIRVHKNINILANLPPLSSVAVGQVLSMVAVNPSTNIVYVANSYDNTMSVIDGKIIAIVNTLQVGNNPHTIAVNPITNDLYISNGDDNTFSVVGGTPQK